MLTAFFAALRRLFVAPEPQTADPNADAPSNDWWIPKDRAARIAAESDKRRRALITRLADAHAPDNDAVAADGAHESEPARPDLFAWEPVPTAVAEPVVTPQADAAVDEIAVDLEEFASLDDVAALIDERRRARDAEAQRVASIELPQAMMMTDEEYAVAQDWFEDHRTVHPLPQAEIYGQYWVRFGRSSIGDSVTIGCMTCARTKILTDFSNVDAAHEARSRA